MKSKAHGFVHRLTDTSPIDVYCTSAICMFVALVGCFLLSRGTLIEHYFFHDTRDSCMDFFHSIEYVRGLEPYAKFNTLYPPLANLFFSIIYFLVPRSVSRHWTDSFSESVRYRGSYKDLRTFQAPMIIFLVILVICCWMMVVLVTYALKGKSHGRANCVALCVLLSPGMLFSFERGNILFLVLPLTLFFILFRNSESPFVRELSLISLAIAAGLKLYPAFFGILLLRDKRFTAAVRAIFYGILSVVLPCFFFKEGLQGIPMWLSIVFRFGSEDAMPWVGTGFANILHRIALWADLYFGVEIGTAWFSKAGFIIAAVFLLSALLSKKEWQSLLAITMAITMYQSQGSYILCFFCIPAVLFLRDEDHFSLGNVIPFFLITLMSVNLPLFYVKDVSYPNILVRQAILLMLCVWCTLNLLGNLFHLLTANKHQKAKPQQL